MLIKVVGGSARSAASKMAQEMARLRVPDPMYAQPIYQSESFLEHVF